MSRSTWKSKVGFIFAAAGSAVGLANIWRFPYMVGKYGGAAFICVYLACLFLIGIPVFISEVLIGRTTQKNPRSAFKEIGKNKFWTLGGLFTIITGFLVSTFYGVVAAWVLGYLISAFLGDITHFTTLETAQNFFMNVVSDPLWSISFLFFFAALCYFFLVSGVRKGLERGSEIMVPFLIVILIILVINGVTSPGADLGLSFYLKPDWSLITPMSFLFALGHAFFTLSLGQGTMITYGSYLPKKESILNNCLPVAAIDTGIALLAGFAIFPMIFSVGISPSEGPPLVFYTLPLVFSKIKGGYLLAILFFLLLELAALTSQISAMEPLIAYLVDEKKWKRTSAATLVSISSFALGVPAALSNFIEPRFTIFGKNYFEFISDIALEIMIPIGGLLAVLLLAWKWGMKKVYEALSHGSANYWIDNAFMKGYLWFTIKYAAPVLVLIIMIQSLVL